MTDKSKPAVLSKQELRKYRSYINLQNILNKFYGTNLLSFYRRKNDKISVKDHFIEKSDTVIKRISDFKEATNRPYALLKLLSMLKEKDSYNEILPKINELVPANWIDILNGNRSLLSSDLIPAIIIINKKDGVLEKSSKIKKMTIEYRNKLFRNINIALIIDLLSFILNSAFKYNHELKNALYQSNQESQYSNNNLALISRDNSIDDVITTEEHKDIEKRLIDDDELFVGDELWDETEKEDNSNIDRTLNTWVGQTCASCHQTISEFDLKNIMKCYNYELILPAPICSNCYIEECNAMPDKEDIIHDESWEDFLEH